MADSELAPGTAHRKSVLFVDDEPKVLQGLERMLRGLRSEWTMKFVAGGPEALTAMETEKFDVIVTDMRMPGMNGVQLMEQVVERHPHVIRIALSGHAERDVVVKAVRLAHQYLSKPCEGDFLKEKLTQALRLRHVMESPTLQAITSRVSSLPSVPALYAQLMAEMQSANPSIQKVGEIIGNDPAITAKILQLINSAFFGLRAYISDPARAVQLLGLETVKSLALSVQVFSRFERHGRANPAEVWAHSVRTAHIAGEVAKKIGLDAAGVQEAFTGGLLHDVGKLVLAEAIPEYDDVLKHAQRKDGKAVMVEKDVFGASHAEVGAYLFGLWGLPYGIVEAVAWHHNPAESGIECACALTAVHIANAIDHERHPGAEDSDRVDDHYLSTLGLSESFAEWKTTIAAHETAA
jgi:putative nucleotidyltransferase with HDIG domain